MCITSLGGLVEPQTPGSHPAICDSVGPDGPGEFAFLTSFPHAADAAGLK